MMAIEGIEQGWLTPIRSRVETVADMDLSKVKIDVGDFNSKQLNEQLTKQSVIHTIAAKTLAIASGRQTVLFCRAIDQSRRGGCDATDGGECGTHRRQDW